MVSFSSMKYTKFNNSLSTKMDPEVSERLGAWPCDFSFSLISSIVLKLLAINLVKSSKYQSLKNVFSPPLLSQYHFVSAEIIFIQSIIFDNIWGP